MAFAWISGMPHTGVYVHAHARTGLALACVVSGHIACTCLPLQSVRCFGPTWMNRRLSNYFLKQGATGVVDGRKVTWDPVKMIVVDTQSGEVLHDLHAGFREMERIIHKALFDSLRKIARERVLCWLPPGSKYS